MTVRHARSPDLAERCASVIQSNLVPVVSAIHLGFVLVTLVDITSTADPLSVALAIAALAGLLGLTVDRRL